MTKPIAERLEDLARRVDQLIPQRRDPNAYHEEKSEIVAQLRQAAKDAKDARA